MSDADHQISSYIGPYKLEERLGRGGMGEVYRAWDERLQRKVALKQIRPTAETANSRERFRREARATARLNHPAIVQIHDILEAGGCDWIVMELVEGKTVALLLQAGPFEIGQACHLALQVTTGLVAAHAAGVLHRDLKTENVIVTPSGNAKILDFGLAKSLWSGSWDRTISGEGQVIGTPRAMSPEQAMGRPIDHRSDLFSLGVLIYEMVTGLSPFQGPGPFETVSRVCSLRQVAAHDHNHDVPIELSRLINRLLEKEPDRRPQGAEEVVNGLHSLMGNMGSASGIQPAPAVGSGIFATSSLPAASSIMAVPADAATLRESQLSQWMGTGGLWKADGGFGAATQAIQTLMLTDLVDSTALVENLGDQRTLEIFARHDRLARSLLERWGGREIDKSDGFLLLFKRPSDAVRYAIDYHAALQELAEDEGVVLTSRVGIHLGEIFLRENPPDEVARGAKPLEVEGFAKSTAARVMGLAGGRQTLLSRGAYELAHRALAHATDLPDLCWMSHGLYRMKGVAEPMEICEVGVKDFAPLRRPADATKAVRFVPNESRSGTVRKPEESSGRATSERRQITLMCCELVSSTDGSSSTSLDPEVLFEVMPEFQDLVHKAVEHYGGYLGSSQGHRMIVYFGYPQAHEDAARRAVLAGLEVAGASAEHCAEDPGSRLAVRVAVHTGPAVVMASPQQKEQLVLGVTQELATGTLGLSGAHQVVVTSSTRQLISKHFRLEQLVPALVPGMDLPIEGFRVLEHTDSQTGETAPLSKLVARERELGIFLELWHLVQDGVGQVVVLNGEAGIGKSRLVQEMRERLAGDQPIWLTAYGSPYTQNSPLAPVVDMLVRNFEIDRHDPPADQLRQLREGLRRFGLPAADFVPYLGPLLALPLDPEVDAPQDLSPELHRQRTLEALVTAVQEVAERQPALMLIEDLQWVDPSTLEMIGMLVEHAEAVPMLLVLTHRPEFKQPWEQSAQLTQVNLRRMTSEQIDALIVRITDGKALPDEARRLIADKTDGVPLFVEEMVKTLLDSGQLVARDDRYEMAEPLRPLEVPATLRDLLLARLDALGKAKEVAQVASCIGREFSFEMLAALDFFPETSLEDELGRLVKAELLRRKGFMRRARYVFKHALIQDAAYESLLKPRRREIHRGIAQVLKERFAEVRERQPEILGQHFEKAGMNSEAITFLHLAGKAATARSAYVEAGRHLDQGLRLIETLPLTNERRTRELDLLQARGVVQTALKGYAADEVQETLNRAREICEALGEGTPQLFAVLYGLWQCHFNRADRELAAGFAQRVLDLAEHHGDVYQKIVAHANMGLTSFFSGEFERARDFFVQALDLNASLLDESLAVTPSTNDIVVIVRLYLAWNLWLLGRPVESRTYQEFDEEELSGFDLAHAIAGSTIFAHAERDVESVRQRGERLCNVAIDLGFPFWKVWGDLMVAWTRAVTDEADEGVALIEQGLASYRAMGQRLTFGYLHSFLADAYLAAGSPDKGLTVIEDALAATRDGLERFYVAELLRLKGDLLLDGQRDAAAECYREAVGMAREQGARMLELRAATSLARLLRDEPSERRLAELRESFPERECLAMEDAAKLLEELASPPVS